MTLAKNYEGIIKLLLKKCSAKYNEKNIKIRFYENYICMLKRFRIFKEER